MSPSDDGRVDRIVDLVTHLAAGDFSARQEPSGVDDSLDAIMVGVNMLAEELEAARDELEHRVRTRTAEIERINRDLMQLTELGNLLQTCGTREEAYAVVRHGVTVIFAGLSGAVYLFNASRNLLENVVSWGEQSAQALLSPEDCWGLRQGRLHMLSGDGVGVRCAHVEQGACESICVPMAAQGETIGLLHLTRDGKSSGQSTSLVADATQQLSAAVGTEIALSLANLELRETLRRQALRDPLTGLYNRRFVEDWIEREMNRAEHAGTSLGVLMADVDHFKQVNDLYGHDAGDQVLAAVGGAIRDSVRAGDVPCRYGGEEFLVLLTDISIEDLLTRAETLRSNVERLHVQHEAHVMPAVTLSVGAALYPQHGEVATDVIRAADTALYAAKRAGRNRVMLASSN